MRDSLFPIFHGPDSGEGVNIGVVQTEGDAGARAAAGMAEVKEKADALTASAQQSTAATKAETEAQRALNESLKARPATASDKAYGEQMTSSAATTMAAGDDSAEADREAIEERRNALISQRVAIEEAETELLDAQPRAKRKRLPPFQAEIEVRSEALGLMRLGFSTKRRPRRSPHNALRYVRRSPSRIERKRRRTAA